MPRPNLRVGAAAGAARGAGALSRALKRGGGTALPGLVAERVAPDLLARLAAQLPQGAVVVTGTNGKTTTSHMLAAILGRAGLQTLRNASGSNLARGVATALAARAGWTGRLDVAPTTVGLFETDEAAFAQIVPAVRPRVVVVTNLFRDQLDRYGEVDTVAAIWRDTLRCLAASPTAAAPTPTPATTLVLNADDPTVASLGGPLSAAPSNTAPPDSDARSPFPSGKGARGLGQDRAGGVRSIYFGIDDTRWGHPGLEHAADAKVCPTCGARLDYPVCFYGHLGHYLCPNGHGRPQPDVRAGRLALHGFAGTELTLALSDGEADVHLPVPGLYNVYNALAAAAAAIALGAPPEAIKAGLEQFTAAFGRLERVEIDGRTLYLLLAKNPVGMNEALRTLVADGESRHLLLALNDLDADGRDVSWIWDADFERLAGHAATLTISGRRADDLAVRLKYAGALDGAEARIDPDLPRALDATLAAAPPGAPVFAVLTYTAMLQFRRALADRGHVRPYWEGE